MGHSHSSASFRGAGAICSAHSGVAGPAAESGWLNRASVWLLLAGVRFYQVVLAPLTFSVCKFYPTCSHYATEAIARHGARHGLRLAAARLWRCRPGTQGGFDPVPEVEESSAQESSVEVSR
jgi:putative membrane protein insertion efficiency factor